MDQQFGSLVPPPPAAAYPALKHFLIGQSSLGLGIGFAAATPLSVCSPASISNAQSLFVLLVIFWSSAVDMYYVCFGVFALFSRAVSSAFLFLIFLCPLSSILHVASRCVPPQILPPPV